MEQRWASICHSICNWAQRCKAKMERLHPCSSSKDGQCASTLPPSGPHAFAYTWHRAQTRGTESNVREGGHMPSVRKRGQTLSGKQAARLLYL
eukprot:scaffold302061_cov22-Tisochrysis_lutea.AAC.4